jgi:large subunit ribosomal protein L4
MSTVDVYNTQRERVGEIELDAGVFGCEVKEHLLYAAVRYQRAKARSGSHQVKERSDVQGGGRKPWRQKGTGRARQGSIRSPQWRGGGVVFGPHVRSHAFKLNKKVRAAALRSALSRRADEGKIVVLDAATLPAPKTREMVAFLERFELKNMLLVLLEADELVSRSSQNLKSVTVLPTAGLNVYDVLHRDNLVLTRDAVTAIVDRLGA